jgi:hypothetical protein
MFKFFKKKYRNDMFFLFYNFFLKFKNFDRLHFYKNLNSKNYLKLNLFKQDFNYFFLPFYFFSIPMISEKKKIWKKKRKKKYFFKICVNQKIFYYNIIYLNFFFKSKKLVLLHFLNLFLSQFIKSFTCLDVNLSFKLSHIFFVFFQKIERLQDYIICSTENYSSKDSHAPFAFYKPVLDDIDQNQYIRDQLFTIRIERDIINESFFIHEEFLASLGNYYYNGKEYLPNIKNFMNINDKILKFSEPPVLEEGL